MPKVNPHPKASGSASNPGKPGGGGGGGGPASKQPGSKPTPTPKLQLFDTARFKAATRDLSNIAKERGGQGAISSTLFVAFVGLIFVGLGIYLLIHGDEDNIVDLIVLGGLLLAMGVGTLVTGFMFVIVPVFVERRRRGVADVQQQTPAPPQSSVIAATRALASTASAVFPTEREAELSHSRSPTPPAGPSRPSLAPDDEVLYDRNSLNAVPDNDRRGKLIPPSPPPISHPSESASGVAHATTERKRLEEILDDISSHSDDELSHV